MEIKVTMRAAEWDAFTNTVKAVRPSSTIPSYEELLKKDIKNSIVLFRTSGGNISMHRNAEVGNDKITVEFISGFEVIVPVFNTITDIAKRTRYLALDVVSIAKEIKKFIKESEDGNAIQKAAYKLIMAIPGVEELVGKIKIIYEISAPYAEKLRDYFVSVDE